MAGVLYRLGRLCVKRAVLVVAVWLCLAVAVHLVVWRVGAARPSRTGAARSSSTSPRARSPTRREPPSPAREPAPPEEGS